MNRQQLKKYIYDEYGVEPDTPWISDQTSEVYRHGNNKKWFALIMDVPKCKLGLGGLVDVEAVNLKCDPVFSASIRDNRGIFPAYHMNKSKWITVILDGTVEDDMIKMLVDISYDLTSSATRKKKGSADIGEEKT